MYDIITLPFDIKNDGVVNLWKKMVEKLASIVFDVTGKNYSCKIINEDKKADMTDPLEEFFENSKDNTIKKGCP